MPSNAIFFEGFRAEISVDETENIFVGNVFGTPQPIVFFGKTLEELKKNFMNAIAEAKKNGLVLAHITSKVKDDAWLQYVEQNLSPAHLRTLAEIMESWPMLSGFAQRAYDFMMDFPAKSRKTSCYLLCMETALNQFDEARQEFEFDDEPWIAAFMKGFFLHIPELFERRLFIEFDGYRDVWVPFSEPIACFFERNAQFAKVHQKLLDDGFPFPTEDKHLMEKNLRLIVFARTFDFSSMFSLEHLSNILNEVN